MLDADPDDPFVADPADLWPKVLHRQSGTTAWFAHYPEDATTN